MFLPEDTIVLTNEGHYPLSEVGNRLVWDGESWVAPTFASMGQTPVFNIQVSVDGRQHTIVGAGSVVLADETIVLVSDLAVQSEVQEVDEDGNPLANEQGDPVMTIVAGSQLKAHGLCGSQITVVSRSEAGTMAVYQSQFPIALSCGVVS